MADTATDEAAPDAAADDDPERAAHLAAARKLGVATVVRPCLIGAAVLAALHAVIGVKY